MCLIVVLGGVYLSLSLSLSLYIYIYIYILQKLFMVLNKRLIQMQINPHVKIDMKNVLILTRYIGPLFYLFISYEAFT